MICRIGSLCHRKVGFVNSAWKSLLLLRVTTRWHTGCVMYTSDKRTDSYWRVMT